MRPLLDARTMAKLDGYTIETVGLPGAVLMEVAGRGVVGHIEELYGQFITLGTTAVLCGMGNNGGDGFVISRCLMNAGYGVETFLLGEVERVKGDAKLHLDAYLASGGAVTEVHLEEDGELAEYVRDGISSACLIVDAIFGTGLTREIEGVPAKVIDLVNRAGVVVAVDIPSGVDADTGDILGISVKADLTVTFGCEKKGHYLYPGASVRGALELVEIGIPASVLRSEPAGLLLVERRDFVGTFARSAEAHKGHFGHVAILAGGRGKMGAAGLAAMAALRAGAGLVTVAFPSGLMAEARLPMEIMTLPLDGGDGSKEAPTQWLPGMVEEVKELIASVDAIAVGPGMGTGGGAGEFLGKFLELEARPPTILDADALTLLARLGDVIGKLGADTILTPHPGEAARLLGCENAQIQGDRPGSVRELASRWGTVAVLKGAATLVCEEDAPISLVACGNPGMATAGSGDILTGIITAFAARGLPSERAAVAGAFIHASAGDSAALKVGVEGMTAGDILKFIAHEMRQLAAEYEYGECP